MDFDKLVATIQSTSSHLQQSAVKAVNVHLTLRNWLIGYYIVEFEQKGEDKARYGEKLLSLLASELQANKLKNVNERELRSFRTFYITYSFFTIHLHSLPFYALLASQLEHFPIRGTLSPELENAPFSVLPEDINPDNISIRGTVSPEFQLTENQLDIKYFNNLFFKIPYSHFNELIKIKEDLKRKFYELLIIKNTLSVRELERHISTLTFERLGLSGDYQVTLNQIRQKISPEQSTDIVKSHYFFEFLNIKQPHLIEESELEQALIEHLQQFIIELGNGFCFEARQKRILIGDEYYFIDLVFYHRILKCHVLIELKTEKASHEHIGQLKTYINFYKKNMVLPGDNPPVGILLATSQNKTLVEYAVADSDKEIFVSQYLLQLPAKEQLASFIDNEINNL